MTARYPTKRATSAGGLVYADRPDGRWVVLIAHRDTAGRLQWTLPKGGLEDGEDFERAAVREVAEETGLEAEITGKLGVVDYWFVWKPDQVRYHKFVHYFLMVHRGGDLRYRDDEAEEVTWLPIEQAVTRLSHANERRLILDAHPDLCPGLHPEDTCPDLAEDANGQAQEQGQERFTR
ncbi:MAG: NUDIX hydrolase [Egibacteraceae bacterium]